MKLTMRVMSVFFGILLVSAFFVVQPSYADNYGQGSHITDTLQIGVITNLGDRKLDIETRFEKTAKNYSMVLHPDAYVMTAKRGEFKKFKELKKGDLIAAYGWYKDGKWVARRIDLLDPNDYLVKRLAEDAKAGAYYKHER